MIKSIKNIFKKVFGCSGIVHASENIQISHEIINESPVYKTEIISSYFKRREIGYYGLCGMVYKYYAQRYIVNTIVRAHHVSREIKQLNCIEITKSEYDKAQKPR